MYTLSDTIVALSTASGVGALAVVRLSGNEAVIIADKIFIGSKPVTGQQANTVQFGRIMKDDRTIDEVVLTLYRMPRSYTGEDTVEISCHGSPYIIKEIIEVCLFNGARMAHPGEFTLRAFLKGKMDLTQAEAVADLIASESGAAHKTAIHNLRGGFSNQLKDMREELIRFSALIELELDFSQEDVEFADRSQLYDLLDRLATTTRRLIDSFQLGNVMKHGINVAIVGKPNAGKSTLLNALLNEERSIVSDIAGTTRDTIEEVLNINGILFRLVDTAGLRSHTTDTIEQIGIERSKAAMNKADIIIYLFDVNEFSADSLHEELQAQQQTNSDAQAKYLAVGNKVDKTGLDAAKQSLPEDNILFISALNKENIDLLKDQLYQLAINGQQPQEGTIVINARHLASLQEVLTALHEVKKGMDDNLPGDLVSLDIRRCLYYLGDITGEVTTEDKLDFIFSKFCIGK